MPVPAPPSRLKNPNYFNLKAENHIHRVHLSTYSGNSFNPCSGGKTRFAPISNIKGECVPSLYAGSEIECAVYETIFHDVPVKALMKSVRKKDVVIRSHTELKVQRPLNLVALFNPDLKAWRITRDALIASTPEYYTDTAKWAEAVHKNFPEADGLVWTSNHCDPQLAYLFFGDRVAEKDFHIKSVRDGKVDSSFLADVRHAGQRAGITITL